MKDNFIANLTELFSSVIEMEKKSSESKFYTPEFLLDAIDLELGKSGSGQAETLALLQRIAAKTTKTSGNKFFNQLFAGRIDIALLADMLAIYLNVSMYTYKVAGIHVLIEQEVIRRMANFIGFGSESGGIFTPGGSLSNFVAMTAARNDADPNIKDEGIGQFVMTAYTSCQSHYSLTKNANLIGIGRNNIRKITVDTSGAMLLDELEEKIKADIAAGKKPFFINATTGTTVLGAFDHVEKIADIAEKYNIWLHVDGAWGGSLLLNQDYRHLFKGIDRANSFTWDAHKMMGVPLVASAIIFKDNATLQKQISEPADYLFQADNDFYNPGTRSIQCGRKNDALKVWAAWKMLGDEGYAERIAQQRRLTLYLADLVDRDPSLKLHCQPQALNVCFDVIGKSSKAICQKLDQAEKLKIGYGTFKDHCFIRAICVNPDLTEKDLDNMIQEIKEITTKI